jgi:hypothetical protein
MALCPPSPRLAVHASACLALLAPAAGAQSTPAAPGGEVVTMGKFQVKDVPIEKQILPTARPFTSVFGTADNIVDVPRNVTIISRPDRRVSRGSRPASGRPARCMQCPCFAPGAERWR